MTKRGSRAFSLGVALVTSIASVSVIAQVVVVVGGVAVYKDRKATSIGAAGRRVGLYALGGKAGPRIVSAVTSDVGAFTLVANYDMQGEDAFVVDEQGAAEPLPVHIPKSKDTFRKAEEVKLQLISCDAARDIVASEDLKTCLTAKGQTLRIQMKAHAVSLNVAAEQFSEMARPLLFNVPRWQEEDVRVALGELQKPFGKELLPTLPSTTTGQLLTDAHQIVASRDSHCLPNEKAAPSGDSYMALGDRCEGDTVVPTAGGPKLVSLTQGEPRVDKDKDAIALSWGAVDGEVCLTVQPRSADAKLPRWRMTRRGRAGEQGFTWNVGRARALGVALSSLGFLAEECRQIDAGVPRLVPVRLDTTSSGNPSVVAMIRTTSEVRFAEVTAVDTRDDKTTETIHPKVATFSPHDPHPLISFAIPRASKGAGAWTASVTLRGPSSDVNPRPISFTFRHE